MATRDSTTDFDRCADLISHLTSLAPHLGANEGPWPGLTVYRFAEPTRPTWEEIRSMSLGVIAQGSKAVVVDGDRLVYDASHYLVLADRLNFTAEIIEATAERPFLSFVLQIDPSIVRKIANEMSDRRVPGREERGDGVRSPSPSAFVSHLDGGMTGAVLRFLDALRTPSDRAVLAPLYVQELVYRILQLEQNGRLLELTAKASLAAPFSDVVAYISEHFAEDLPVAELAALANLSPSAFSRRFRAATGRSPHRLVTELRLDRAREVLESDSKSVAQVSRLVGYSSVSHFIAEFRDRFGVTPGAWAHPSARAVAREEG